MRQMKCLVTVHARRVYYNIAIDVFECERTRVIDLIIIVLTTL